MQEVWEHYHDDLTRVESLIAVSLKTNAPVIKQVARYLLSSGGKRIRPLLLILSARLFRYRRDPAALLAAVVEFIHTATLLHDDVLDRGELRRGKRAPRTVWGDRASILTGDYLYAMAVVQGLRLDSRDVNYVLLEACRQMIEGEAAQASQNGNIRLSEKAYLEIIQCKTASLISAACRLGGIIGRADRRQQEALGRYGLSLGIAFQVLDDTLDYTAPDKQLGKAQGKDFEEGRITLPLLHLLHHCPSKDRRLVLQLLRNGHTREDLNRIQHLMHRYGSITYAQNKARRYIKQAKLALDPFPASPAKRALELVADYVLTRDH
jgi:octaprenyl-diphosphate synthase